MKQKEKTKARTATLKLLYEQEFNKNNRVEKNQRSKSKKQEYMHTLYCGVQQNQKQIDSLIKESSTSWAIHRISLMDLNIMRIAVFEMLYLSPSIPFKVCIDEAVEMAKIYSGADSPKFINGNLDAISKKFKLQ